jgi:hypothetical protein
MVGRLSHEEVDRRFRTEDLEPLEPYLRADAERRCRCLRCGTTRWVRLRNLRRADTFPCRWCHGWESWLPWSETARARAAQWRPINSSIKDSIAAIERIGMVPLTPAGDEFTPIGFLCPRCGETGVTVPERIDGAGDRDWYGCPRCALDHTRQVLADAPALFETYGLRLLDGCRGEYTPQAAECLACETRRKVALADLRDGTAPLCWTCTHGIRVDEPHRIYLSAYGE